MKYILIPLAILLVAGIIIGFPVVEKINYVCNVTGSSKSKQVVFGIFESNSEVYNSELEHFLIQNKIDYKSNWTMVSKSISYSNFNRVLACGSMPEVRDARFIDFLIKIKDTKTIKKLVDALQEEDILAFENLLTENEKRLKSNRKVE